MELMEVLGAWDPGLRIDQQGVWAQDVRAALRDGGSASISIEALGEPLGWILLGWCENSSAAAVRADDFDLLELTVVGLGLVSRSHIDRREVLLVGSLARRAAELLAVNWDEFRQRFADDPRTLELVGLFPSAVSPASHREVGSGAQFRFEKVPLARSSEAELLRRLGGG